MKINIKDEGLKKDLESLLTFIQESNSAYMQEVQEYIVAEIYLLTNISFRNEISKLRAKYSVPRQWYVDKIDTSYAFNSWILSQQNDPPQFPSDPDIQRVCRIGNVDPRAWGVFIVDYLYFGSLYPLKPPVDYYVNSEDEYRYKCRIEVISKHNTPDTIITNDRKGYIRFYRDTTIEGLYKFIEANREKIRELQEDMQDYPYARTEKYKTFKRDIQIYLLYLLGYEVTDDVNKTKIEKNLLERLQKDNVLDEKDFVKKNKKQQLVYAENGEDTYYIDTRTAKYKIKEIEQRIKALYE